MDGTDKIKSGLRVLSFSDITLFWLCTCSFMIISFQASSPTGVSRETQGDSHMKGAGMLVISRRGVNFGFWSHLRCSGQNTIIFSHEGLI